MPIDTKGLITDFANSASGQQDGGESYIFNEPDSISRVYDELETVVEEKTLLDKTSFHSFLTAEPTHEESKIEAADHEATCPIRAVAGAGLDDALDGSAKRGRHPAVQHGHGHRPTLERSSAALAIGAQSRFGEILE